MSDREPSEAANRFVRKWTGLEFAARSDVLWFSMRKLIKASWGCGATWVDVTSRVRQLLQLPHAFATPADLQSDPALGCRKQLQLIFDADPPVVLDEGTPIRHGITALDEPNIDKIIALCEDSLSRYAALRADLFQQLIKLKTIDGAPWLLRYTRDAEHGDPTLPAKLISQTATLTMLGGVSVDGPAIITNQETYAPFYDFRILDSGEERPRIGTAAQKLEQRIEFLLNQLLNSVKSLTRSLIALQQHAGAIGRHEQCLPLTRLEIALPVFPYWPKSPAQMAAPDFDQLIRDENRLIEDARVALKQLLNHRVSIGYFQAAPDHFQRALEVLHNTGRAMEEHPSTYKSKSEEDLRDHFLSVLASHFSSVTGETFRKKGKTDILLQHDGAIVLVAECKFWGGKKTFERALDQLLSYLTWRDSRTALVLFVPNDNIGRVLSELVSSLTLHPHFRGGGDEIRRGWYSARFAITGKLGSMTDLSIMCFHFPRA